ncbi:MAG: AAA family ATPase [Gammaproteobacteria bacterium]|nr:AAA family ATPase [Gammaproteobacteria bacterium]
MKIKAIEITNFRAIERIKATSIGDMVIIAGPNGSGKSCILDAIRLAKSTYGGYQTNEWDLWVQEFQINAKSEPWELKKLLRQSEKKADIKVAIELSTRESEYIREKQDDLLQEAAFGRLFPGRYAEEWRRLRQEGGIANLQADTIRALAQEQERLKVQLKRELENLTQEAHVTIFPEGRVSRGDNIALETIWRIYEPERVGIIDYHGSHRNYARENVAGINLSLKSHEEQQKQHTLYNYGHKYANIKTEMATEFVQDMLRKEGGATDERRRQSLEKTLQELFNIFFPGKEFSGARADQHGSIKFPVVIGESEHDINELSSGEKEILYGYLRLRSSARRDSIILLDEPELHLNPKLIQGLPQFYERYLVSELENQMWLVTHSDALLREALSTPRATVFHMQEAKGIPAGENQLKRVEENKDEEHVVLEIVGDIAGYRPRGKVVIFEGKNAGFDVRMASRLFPEYEKNMNFIAGGNKIGVERLHKCLEARDGEEGIKIYSIVDRDGSDAIRIGDRRYSWDVYHIENYLLEPTYIHEVLNDSTVDDLQFKNAAEIEDELRRIAERHVQKLVKEQLHQHVNRTLVSKIVLEAEDDHTLSETLLEQAEESAQRVLQAVEQELRDGRLEEKRQENENKLEEALGTDDWKEMFRGRDILKEFSGLHCNGLPYERFRDMIVNRMQQRGYQPSGMRAVLRKINND